MNKLFDDLDRLYDKVTAPKYKSARGAVCLAFNFLATLTTLFMAYMPICEAGKSSPVIIRAMDALTSAQNTTSFYLVQFCALMAIGACFLIMISMFIKGMIRLPDEDALVRGAKTAVTLSTVSVTIYTIFTFVFSIINQMIGGHSVARVSYFPLIYALIVDLLFALTIGSVYSWKERKDREALKPEALLQAERKKLRRSLFWKRFELLIYVLAVCAVAIAALMSKLVTVTFDEIPGIPDYVLKGNEVLFEDIALRTSGERTVSFLLYTLFLAVIISCVMTIAALISRSSEYNNFAIAGIAIGGVTCAFIGLFGQYYRVVQRLNVELVDLLLTDYSIASKDLLLYEIKSETIVYLFIAAGLITFIILRKPFSRARDIERRLDEVSLAAFAPSMNLNGVGNKAAEQPKVEPRHADEENEPQAPTKRPKADFDPCPAFTEIDGKREVYSACLAERRATLFATPTLPALVNYIVQYARDCDHHLFYTPEAIAAFLAGLGSTKLTILQGMSGTGKTSLPKIVAEALNSVCDIVEVESAWRDKNELLGYYNEFNKIYTPKKFTQALYRASLNKDTLTFIVLDEMNLSRIEYYFSDFLSLMEHDPDKRELKLLNTPLFRTENGEKIEYAGLEDGHTLRIPENVWFIGTANRDESTYDISDKVYDRAHTMNFDKRAQKPTLIGNPISAKYLPVSELTKLFDRAKLSIRVDIDDYPAVKRVEELLEPYGISFGNRIAMQIESFVSIYASCFAYGDNIIRDAFDTILLSKVVKKLELKVVDDAETLAAEFSKIGFERCSHFVQGLKED